MINIYNEDFSFYHDRHKPNGRLKNNKFNFETFLNEYFSFNYYISDMEDAKQKKTTSQTGRYNYTREYLARLTTHFNILIDNNLIIIEDIRHIKKFIRDVSKELYQHRPNDHFNNFLHGFMIDEDVRHILKELNSD